MGATQSVASTCVLNTLRGSLRGVELADLSDKSIYQRFTRIPYALPPTGDLRWRRPQPLPEDFSFDARNGQPGDYTTFGPVCPQPEYGHGAALLQNDSAAAEPDRKESEDCLYLNIWRPCGEPPASGWPVQFFIRLVSLPPKVRTSTNTS